MPRDRRQDLLINRRQRLLLAAEEAGPPVSPTLGTFTFSNTINATAVGYNSVGGYGTLDPTTYLDKTITYVEATIAGADHIRIATTTADKFTYEAVPVESITLTIEGAPKSFYVLPWNVGLAAYKDEVAAEASALRSYLIAQISVPLEMTLEIT